MFKDAPFMSGQSQHFSDPEKAVTYVKEIYEANIDYLRESFEEFTKGETPTKKIEAFYPYVAIDIKHFEMKDTRLSYGFISKPGCYSTTLTRPDIFWDYYLEQFQQLLSNHKQELEIGVSDVPIPVHFAFQNGKPIENNLSSDKTALLRELFSLVLNKTNSFRYDAKKEKNGTPAFAGVTGEKGLDCHRPKGLRDNLKRRCRGFTMFPRYNIFKPEFCGSAFLGSAS